MTEVKWLHYFKCVEKYKNYIAHCHKAQKIAIKSVVIPYIYTNLN